MQIGERLGPYEIRDVLGQGGMAQVFKAWHSGLHRFEALKVPLSRTAATSSQGERAFISRFLNEARTAAGLRHPHIATVYNVSEADAPQPYFAMELVEGEDLAELIQKRGHISLQEALMILEPVAQALDYAHECGIIHRDIKPGNILLEESGSGWNPKVVDFGIARAAQIAGMAGQTHLTQSGAIVGTPEYMSPEQAGSGDKVDRRTDIYSLGVVVYEMLCGRPPFFAAQDTSPISVLVQHVRDVPPLPSSFQNLLSAHTNEALLWILSKHPDERPSTCMAFVEALRPSLPQSTPSLTSEAGSTPIAPEVVQTAPAVALPSKKFPFAVPIALIAGLLIIGAVGFRSLTTSPSAPSPAQEVPHSQPTIVPPPPDPKVQEAAALTKQAMPLIDEASAEMQELSDQLDKGKITREDALTKLKVQSNKFIKARDLASRAVHLDRSNEDAWLNLCRASYFLDECATEKRLKEATKIFPKSSRFKPLIAVSKKSMKDGCE